LIVVIQCAAGKQPHAGRLQTADGTPILFVADPAQAPAADVAYARPDDVADEWGTWRNLLLEYNSETHDNPLGLLPAYKLYSAPIYEGLAAQVGLSRLYILSAGWGLIPATFLTPSYDITFSQQAEPYKRRRQNDHYRDFFMPPEAIQEPVVFFGGKDYLPLFSKLTEGVAVPRVVPYCSEDPPKFTGLSCVKFETARRTNWHYECAQAFLDGNLALPIGD